MSLAKTGPVTQITQSTSSFFETLISKAEIAESASFHSPK